jgi:branched-subunit amino acid permease
MKSNPLFLVLVFLINNRLVFLIAFKIIPTYVFKNPWLSYLKNCGKFLLPMLLLLLIIIIIISHLLDDSSTASFKTIPPLNVIASYSYYCY